MNAVQDIIDKNLTCYFISPHFDDAVYSASGLISQLVKKVPVKVINVFTTADEPSTLSARQFLKYCGYKNVTDLYSDRLKEDRVVLKKLKVEGTNLNFSDALWRKKKKYSTKLANVLPEAVHVYPTYRLHMAKGKVAKSDRILEEDLKNILKKIINKETAVVFCPLGLGKHVDHILVRDVCKDLGFKLIYWLDYPYALTYEPDKNYLNTNVVESFSIVYPEKIKMKLIRLYKSQYKAMFSEKTPVLLPEKFFVDNNFIL